VLALSRTERALLALVVLLTGAAAATRYTTGVPDPVAFLLAGLALAGQAYVVSLATEQLGRRFGASITGVLQATVGNLPEFFVVVFALQAHQTVVAETAILGSILVNALLVLGLVLCAGALRARDGLMRFNARLPIDTATLLLVASFIIVLLGLLDATGDPASHHRTAISVVGAAAILIVYAVWLRQYLAPGREAGGAQRAPARLAPGAAAALLVIAGVCSAFTADWFVHSLQPTIHTLHISHAFAGLVIVAIAGNAVENVSGIVQAFRGEADLAISIVKNSVAQVAAFLYPVLVLVSLALASRLTFAIPPVYIGALFGTAILVWQITGDGEATLFEGVALMATFVILATVAAFEH
jgi:Ca2+:H+ antiporter